MFRKLTKNQCHVGVDAIACSSFIPAVCLCLFCFAQQAHAWVVVSGDVKPADPMTWTSDTFCYFGKTANGTMVIGAGDTVNSAYGFVGDSSRFIGEVIVDGIGSTWTSSSVILVGSYGNGKLRINAGGTVNNADNGYIGCYYRSTGEVIVDGENATWTNGQALFIGSSGKGTMNITGGGTVINKTFAEIGGEPGSSGNVTVNGAGSTWTICSVLMVGRNSYGKMNITAGGTVSTDGWSSIGDSHGSMGEVTVDGVNSTWRNGFDLYVGSFEGRGRLNIINDGVVTVARDTIVDHHPGSSGRIYFNNGTLTTGSLISAAKDLTGTGTVNTHGLVTDVDLFFDATHGTNQTINITKNPGQNIAVNLTVDGSGWIGAGDGGVGTTTISDGRVVESTYGYIGRQSGSTGKVTVDGTGSTWTNSNNLIVGYYGSGSLHITGGGAVAVHGILTIDKDGGGDSFINMSSGGKLALYGNAESSLTRFMKQVQGTDAIRYWDYSISDWADISEANIGRDYTLQYLTEGDLSGYTVLSVGVVPEPSMFVGMLGLCLAGLLGRVKSSRSPTLAE